MPDTRPDPTGVHAVAVTTCPLLAVHLTELHPAVQTALLTRIAGIGTLPDTDALLLLTQQDPLHDEHDGHADDRLPDDRLSVQRLYVGTDLDDASVWARAVKLRADQVLFSPDDDAQLSARLTQHLGASA